MLSPALPRQKHKIAIVRLYLPPETSVYSSLSIYARDPIVSYALYRPYHIIYLIPPPPHIPSIKTLYYDACNATPTGSSAVHDFSNTRRPTSFLESYPAASSQTSNNALIARLSPLISIFIFANRAWYGHYTKGCAKTIKSLNIHYERLNVITHGLLIANRCVHIGKTPSPVYPENNVELNLRV